MGANATTFVPTYVASEVLTAADLNVTNSGIPVFATTVTRDAAFGGTGEKVLAEGQYAYIEATNATQFYDGSTWQTVGGGLNLISTTTITTTGSTNITSCFSSTYTNYRIMWNGLTSASVTIQIQLANSTTPSTTGYFRQRIQANSTSVLGNLSASLSSFQAGNCDSVRPNFSSIDMFSPFEAVPTGYSSLNANTTNTVEMNLEFGKHTSSTSYDSIVFAASSGTFTGTVSIYGYAK
jgi:hypothetical protein